MENMWENLVTQIVLWALGGIFSVVGGFIIRFINKKIKNDTIKNLLLGAVNIVSDGVKFTYQTYVEEIKGTTLWDKDAQERAMQKTVDYVKNTMTQQAKDYIIANYGDLEAWIRQQAEIQINNAKNKIKKESD